MTRRLPALLLLLLFLLFLLAILPVAAATPVNVVAAARVDITAQSALPTDRYQYYEHANDSAKPSDVTSRQPQSELNQPIVQPRSIAVAWRLRAHGQHYDKRRNLPDTSTILDKNSREECQYDGGQITVAPKSGGAEFANELEGEGSWLMTKEQSAKFAEGQATIGRADGQFMTSARRMNSALAEANGDVAKINELLGTQFEPGREQKGVRPTKR